MAKATGEPGPRLLLSKVTVQLLSTDANIGQYAGGVWTSPYSLNITPYVKPGKNTIEVEVINNWKNRLG